MSKVSSLILYSLSILITIYSGYGILQLTELGGPCNGGLVLFVMIPALILSVTLLATAFSNRPFSDKFTYKKRVIFSFISLSIWSFLSYQLLRDSLVDVLLYLGPFELLNIGLCSLLILKWPKSETA